MDTGKGDRSQVGTCNISANELAVALEISVDRLADICDFFDSDPNDDWQLDEGIHFEWGPYQSRYFSPEGAVEICNFVETNKTERPIYTRLRRWFLRRDQRLKGLMIAKRIQEASSIQGRIIFKGGRAFLGPKATREVFGLGRRQDILNKSFEEIQRPDNTNIEQLKIGDDFFEQNEKRYFSRSGLASIGNTLGTSLSKKHRQEWVKAVSEYAPRVLDTLEKHEAARDQRIQRAMDRVRRQARGRCQITNRRKSVYLFDLEVHHLYDQKTYPQLADIEANMIAIDGNIHTHFHQWNGGTKVSSTVENMERYIEEFNDSLFPNSNVEQAMKVALHLANSKSILQRLL